MKEHKDNWNAPFKKVGSSWKGDALMTTRYCSKDGVIVTTTSELRGMVPIFGNRMPDKKLFSYLEEMSKVVHERR